MITPNTMVDEDYNNEEEVEETEEDEENEEIEESDNKVQELEDKLKEAQEELEKERNKDKNFKSLKTAEKTKRLKLSERIDLMEQQLKQEQENRQNLQSSIMKDAKSSALDQLAGDDKDLREQLEERVKNSEVYLGAPKDSKELTERYENAYSYLQGSQKRVNPIHAYSPVTGTQNALGRKGKRFTDTQQGQDVLEQHFPKIVALENKKKK